MDLLGSDPKINISRKEGRGKGREKRKGEKNQTSQEKENRYKRIDGKQKKR